MQKRERKRKKRGEVFFKRADSLFHLYKRIRKSSKTRLIEDGVDNSRPDLLKTN